MGFVEDFEKQMKTLEDAHTQKVADLYAHIMNSTKKRDECLANADAALDREDVDAVVKNRISAEKHEHEIAAYQELMKRAQKDVIVSREQVAAYVQGIKSEYYAREYNEYSKMLVKLNEILEIIDNLHNIHIEALYCGDSLKRVIRLTNTGIDYEPSLHIFNNGFVINRFLEEMLPNSGTVSNIQSVLNTLEPYKTVTEEITEEAGDENE